MIKHFLEEAKETVLVKRCENFLATKLLFIVTNTINTFFIKFVLNGEINPQKT